MFLGRGAGGAHTSICAKSPATLIVVVSVGLLLATVGTVGNCRSVGTVGAVGAVYDKIMEIWQH